MSESPAASGREAALAKFDQERNRFQAAYAGIPDAALSYLPEGDDYALGGLLIHVTHVLERYGGVLRRIREASFGPLQVDNPDDSPESAFARAAKTGLTGANRSQAFRDMRAAHDALVSEASALSAGDFGRTAPVVYGSGDPYPTSPEKIFGWVIGHYDEHIDQAGQMLSDWEKAGGG